MSGLLLLQRRIIPSLSRRVFVLSKEFGDKKLGLKLSTSPMVALKDDDIKNDPDVKNLLNEINKDFKVAIKEDKSSDVESSSESPKDNVSSGKNISQLLSELYGEAEGEKQEKISSIGGYKEYVDSDSGVIYDIDEERDIMRKAYLEGKPLQTDKKSKPSQAEKYKHLAHKRGERGVFEVGELVEVLQAERILDVAVISIPASRQYADYMVVGTARSTRHLRTVSSLLVSLYKSKRLPSDMIPKREGELDTNTGWTAMDMGNIVLHLLTQEKREYYDLEMLWSVGPDFDDNTRNLMAAEEKLETLEDLMATDVDLEELFGRREKEEG